MPTETILLVATGMYPHHGEKTTSKWYIDIIKYHTVLLFRLDR